jgi:hypothetical protein
MVHIRAVLPLVVIAATAVGCSARSGDVSFTGDAISNMTVQRKKHPYPLTTPGLPQKSQPK